jgi:hypothetical protein
LVFLDLFTDLLVATGLPFAFMRFVNAANFTYLQRLEL